MSFIALALNVTLGFLLFAALGMGWRLERRLKALRESHQSFAAAVDDLDRAASRAEQGLADLRAATDEAAEALAIRIERARALTAKLDASIERAEAPRPHDELVLDKTLPPLEVPMRAARRSEVGFAPPPIPARPQPQ